jgi:hypothetical protein
MSNACGLERRTAFAIALDLVGRRPGLQGMADGAVAPSHHFTGAPMLPSRYGCESLEGLPRFTLASAHQFVRTSFPLGLGLVLRASTAGPVAEHFLPR